MSFPARKLQAEEVMAERTVLEERVEHIQKDVADMKKDLRRLDDKVDAVRVEVTNVRADLTAAIGAVRTDLTAEIGSVRTELAAFRSDVKESIGEVKTQIASILGTVKASENALIKWMTGIVLSAIGVASAIAFGIAKLVH